MSDATARRRFTNIHVTQIIRYRLPASGIVSILHRISGAVMFLLLPFILFLFDKSITSEISFEFLKGYVSHPLVKLSILVVCWAYLHHFCAGVRHLVMDMHIGLAKHEAVKSAKIVLAISLLLTLLVAMKLFGVI
ncbi:MAG: succinate dehydrogenase, cytochrome b556 subunit [Pseudomonadota bacterium]|jgi:succinate dehydrogenase / fumarate reductase cytochrome b subunit